MNQNIAEARTQYPEFFAEWDSDPYQTFLKILGHHSYGFPDLSRDDYRNVLEITLDGLGVGEYWNPKLFNSENESFYKKMDECLEHFLKECSELTPENQYDWCKVFVTFTYGAWPHPIMEKFVVENWQQMLNQIKFLGQGGVAYNIAYTLTQLLFRIARVNPPIWEWAIEQIKERPYELRDEIKMMYTRPDKTIDPRIRDWLPKIIMGHRRILRNAIIAEKKWQFKRRKYSKKCKSACAFEIMLLTEKQNFDLAVFIMDIFRGIMDPQQNVKKGDHVLLQTIGTEALKVLAEHSARCPYPPI